MMEVLEQRVADRLAVEIRELEAQLADQGKRRAQLMKQIDTANTHKASYLALLTGGKVPTVKQEQAEVVAERKLRTLARRLATVNRESVDSTAKLAKLRDPAELARRVKHVKSLGVEGEALSGTKAAELVLLHAGKAMRVEEITEAALMTGTLKLNGKTPAQTMSAYLAKAARKGDRFVRVAPATFDLKERVTASA